MRPLGDTVCPGCGKLHWRKQAWDHEKCLVANTIKPVEMVANVVDTVVANEIPVVANKHGVYKDKEARLTYMRELMRKRRAVV